MTGPSAWPDRPRPGAAGADRSGDAGPPPVPRRATLAIALAALLVLAGCGGAVGPRADGTTAAGTAPPTGGTTAADSTTATTTVTPTTTVAGDPDGDGLSAASERRFGLSPTTTNNGTFLALLARVDESGTDRARRLADRFVADGAATADGRTVAAVLVGLPERSFRADSVSGLALDAVLDAPAVNDTVLRNLRVAATVLRSYTFTSEGTFETSRYRRWLRNLTDPDPDGDGVPTRWEADPATGGLSPDPVAGRVADRLGADGEVTDREWRVVRTATRTPTLARQVDARNLSGTMADDELRALTDPDADNATTVYERAAGADPRDPDSDGDGFSDGAELFVLRPAGADPARPDLFVELDSTARAAIPDASIERIREYYAGNGLAVHFVRSDDDLPALDVFDESADAALLDEFDREGLGYVQVVAVRGEVRLGERRLGGYTASDLDFVVFRSSVPADAADPDPAAVAATTHVLAHELGHVLGLLPADYGGIDSFAVPFEEYRSVMNYDAPRRFRGIGYSEGEPFDDWAAIRADRFGNPERPTAAVADRLRTGRNLTVAFPGRASGPSRTADPGRSPRSAVGGVAAGGTAVGRFAAPPA